MRRCVVALGVGLLFGCRDGTGPGNGGISALRIAPDSVRLESLGDSARLEAALTGGRGPAVVWSSADSTVAAVSSTGVVRAKGFGATTVYAAAGALRDSVPVRVGERGVSQWRQVREAASTGESFRAVWGAGDRSVYAVGTGGAIAHYDGTRWTAMQSRTDVTLNGVWGTSDLDVYAVGENASEGVILLFDGSTWSGAETEYAMSFPDVWGTGPNDGYASGAGGTVLRFDGTGCGGSPAARCSPWATGGRSSASGEESGAPCPAQRAPTSTPSGAPPRATSTRWARGGRSCASTGCAGARWRAGPPPTSAPSGATPRASWQRGTGG